MNEKMNGGISTMRGMFCRLPCQKGGITAETIAAAAASDKLISGIFHCLHDCKACRNCVLLAEQIDVYHFFHLEIHSLINIR